ncbi:uncharacterized protein WCC33_017508 [Rhinophrynus dorsalis]
MNNTEVFVPDLDAGPFMARGQKQRCLSALDPHVTSEEDLLNEEVDGFMAVPMRRSCRLRTSVHTLDPFRRHSWEPGKRLQEAESDYEQLSLSLKGLDPGEIDRNMGNRRDPRRTPIIRSTDELESLLALRGEDLEVTQEEHTKRLQAYINSQPFQYNPLSKSVSMSGIERTYCYPDGDCNKRRACPYCSMEAVPFAIIYTRAAADDCQKLVQTEISSLLDHVSVLSDRVRSCFGGFRWHICLWFHNVLSCIHDRCQDKSTLSCSEIDALETDEKENREKEESPLGRTLSFIKRMTSGKSKIGGGKQEQAPELFVAAVVKQGKPSHKPVC